MAKPTVVRTWIAGLITLAAGLLVVGLSIVLMLAYGGSFTPAASGGGYDFVPSDGGFFWLTIGGIVFGGVVTLVAGLIQLVAWVGAVINTYRLPDKTWFAVLLIGGVLGFAFGLVGLVTMVVYLIGGPDGYALQPSSAGCGYTSRLAPTA